MGAWVQIVGLLMVVILLLCLDLLFFFVVCFRGDIRVYFVL